MRPNVYLLLAWRHARLSAALLAVVLIMGACGAFTTIGGASSVPPPGPVSLTVLQRSATLSLSANQTGQATASCQAGEQLLSGGYATTDQTALSAVATPSYYYTQMADFVLDSYPALANGSPPSIQGQSLSSWTVKTAEATPTPLMLTVYANCVKSAAVSTRVYATSAHEVCLVDDPFPQALPASAAASTSAPSTTSSQVYTSAVPNAPARPRSGCGEANQHYQLGCPTSPNFPTLTGGGWRMARGHTTYAVRGGPPGVVIAGQQLIGAFPHQDGPTTHWVVNVRLADADVAPLGTAYAVCAQGLSSQPRTRTGYSFLTTDPTAEFPQAFTLDVTKQQSCPAKQTLVGGGYVSTSLTAPTTNAILPNTGAAWSVRYHTSYDAVSAKQTASITTYVYGICVGL